MILSDREIRKCLRSGRIKITPKPRVMTNGVDLKIGDQIGIDVSIAHKMIDPTSRDSIRNTYEIRNIPAKGYLLEPREFYLLHSREFMEISRDLVGIVKLKSSWARLGLLVPPTVINAGSKGEVVAEVFNFRNAPLLVKKGMPFLHILFEELSSRTGSSYSSGQYYGQRGIRLPEPVKP